MRLLFLSHAHPDLQPGGTEIFSRDLFRSLRARAGIDGLYLAGTSAGERTAAPGTAFQAAGTATDEVLLWTGGFDPFHLSQIDLHGVVPALTALLADLQPDIVHIHHMLRLGVEIPPLIRRLSPGARIVMTLHDYYPICANDGQMRTTRGSLCAAASLDACRRCFSDRSAVDFRLRDLHIRRGLRAVDQFIAPSNFLRERYVAWGLAPSRITVISNALPPIEPVPHRAAVGGRRDRFGFFGHINRFKGAQIALAASARLSRAGVPHSLCVHGGTDFQTEETLAEFTCACDAAPDAVYRGPYGRSSQPALIKDLDWIIVPSLWWENHPLVIQEAFAHRRPVICADVGGMAEAVRDGVDGLHFPWANAAELAAIMRRATEEPTLWPHLVRNIRPIRAIEAAADDHLALYGHLLSQPHPAAEIGA